MGNRVNGRVAQAGWALVAAMAVVVTAGCGSSSSSANGTATPSFSPGGGSYNTSQTVTISDTTPGAVLYCTTDGTTPTNTSPQCSQPTTVAKTEFLQAIAVAPGKGPSAVGSAGYTIDLNAVATPTFSPAGGIFTSTQTVTIADATAGANIFYTVDGTVPTTASTLYAGPVAVSATETLSAIAAASGFSNSGVASAVFVINPLAATPSFSPGPGTYASTQIVTLSDATAGASIYYTTDGSTPTAASILYAGPIQVAQTETVNAIAVASGFGNSAVATAAYIITATPTATPVFTPAAGTYTSTQSVAIADATAGAVIYYTVDGSTPSTTSQVYSAPISVAQNETVKAIAVAPGSAPSAVATAAYTINASATAAPTFSPGAGSYTSAQTVTLSDATAGASIYYTVNGATPTTGSTAYSSPIAVTQTETIEAIATAPGLGTSAVASAVYTITAPTGSNSAAGTVLSGTTPVKGAQVQLYAAGQAVGDAGYGSAATPLGAAATTDSKGAFKLSYNCPASPGDLVYVVATGGDSGSGPNTALKLMAALGPCGAITATSTFTVNEATTVAAVYALSPFMTGAANVGSSTTNYQGLTNAFATVDNLVNPTTGAVLTITPAYANSPGGPVPFLNSSTVPQSRIDTLADILNACTASSGTSGGCSNLFGAATPTGGTAPADTLQAMLNIAQNPGANAATLYSLASPNGPFQPELAGAPNDWTLVLTFTGAGLGIDPNINPNATTTLSNGQTLTGVTPTANGALAIDATGSVWIAATGNAGSPVFPMLAKFNGLGAPLTPATTVSAASPPAVTYGGFNPEPKNLYNQDALAIDEAGNLWVGDAQADLAKVDPGLSTTPSVIVTGRGVASIAVDAGNNIWVASGELLEFKSDGTPIPLSHGFGYGNLTYLLFDAGQNLWGGDQASANGGADLYQLSTTDGSIVYDAFPPPAVGNSFFLLTLVADNSGNVYSCADPSGTSLDTFSPGSEVGSPVPVPTTAGCGAQFGTQLVLDGQSHIFAVTNTTFPSFAASVAEFNTSGVLISPEDGYTGTSIGEAPTINPASTANIPGIGAAIDGSGNLWVLNQNTAGSDAKGNLVSGNVLVEYVGIAAPVVTPTSAALAGTQLGVRP